jgi:hypothetical protein
MGHERKGSKMSIERLPSETNEVKTEEARWRN